VLAPADARILATIGAALVAVAVAAILWPRLLAIPIAVLLVWLGGALLSRAWRLRRRRAARGSGTRPRHPRDAEPPSE
jgi:cardiolipin synthase A/B